jgi:hypothetical protein
VLPERLEELVIAGSYLGTPLSSLLTAAALVTLIISLDWSLKAPPNIDYGILRRVIEAYAGLFDRSLLSALCGAPRYKAGNGLKKFRL